MDAILIENERQVQRDTAVNIASFIVFTVAMVTPFAVVSSTTRPIGTGVGLFNHTAIDQMGGSTFHLIQKQQENDSGWIGCIVVACARRGVVRSLMVQDHSLLSCRVDSKWYVVFDQIGMFSSLTCQTARKINFSAHNRAIK